MTTAKHCNATGTAGGDEGQLQINYGSGFAGVESGDPGQILVSQGAGNPPIFQNVPGVSGSLISEIAISGTQDGVNRAFTLASAPSYLELHRNGQLQRPGAGNDFVLSGSTVTFTVAPAADDWLRAAGY
jgi:hypothetical protein